MERRKPYIVGLTGSIGMGKSTVGQMFVEEGVPLFDADAAVHELQGPDGALVEAIEALFPGSTSSAGVDRQKLGAMVLGDAAALQRLEKLIHPAVAEMRLAFLEKHRDQPLILFDIPLLFEKSGAKGVDHVVVVSAGENDQRDRVLARPGMTEERFEQIKALQMPDAEKRQKADSVIDTSLPQAETRQQVQKLVQKLKASLA
ncbi:dephospho-CoA kinase [Sphingorhabdus sp. M41]|uniref:dephospho-CoA kinase n=1 Tax=Sphingorhabdus sp. M41 TaxID=1806885 RepID=UPI00078D576E|nr:dephospho-CoA kinase [Sphingorhabdus sp. M41]AMO70455.1 dephospho-CoA kinase [Sphingorhabdus sp. M41]